MRQSDTFESENGNEFRINDDYEDSLGDKGQVLWCDHPARFNRITYTDWDSPELDYVTVYFRIDNHVITSFDVSQDVLDQIRSFKPERVDDGE